MDPLLETIDVDLDEASELLFKVKVEGAAQSSSKIRLVCESGDLAYLFNGRTTGEDGVVQFVIPTMKDKLKEGVYSSKVEVLIDNRYFAPVLFQINFKKTISVVAESVVVKPRKLAPEVTVTASSIVARPKPAPAAPSPVPVKASAIAPKKTLQERRKLRQETEEITELDEAALRELTRSFVRTSKKR